jgi:hypothetical protein
MFESVEREVGDRIRQSKDLLRLIKSLSLQDEYQDSDIYKIQKGYLFVSLYSSIEYCLTASVSRFLELLKASPRRPTEYKYYFLCMLLNANFNSVRDCSKKNVWDKRADLIDTLFSENIVDIDTSVFPTDGINISDKQIDDVWKFFHLNGSSLPEGVNQLLLKEIKEHRNAIAHGREKAIDIGGRYTEDALQIKENAVEKLCLHVIEEFKSTYDGNGFLLTQGAA